MEMYENGMNCGDLDKDAKAALLELLAMDVSIHNKTRPLMIALSETTASLARCFQGKDKKISYPEL